MPEWLLKEDQYSPEPDKDTFINKSILSLLNVLSRIRAQSRTKPGNLKINEASKVLFTFLLVILLSVSRSPAFVIVINVYLLLIVSFLSAEGIIRILKVSLTVAAFTFLILLPSIFWGNIHNSLMITSKVFATVMAVNVLSYSTEWSSITSAMKIFFVPDIFILVLDITIKYIILLGEFSLNMLYSLKLRSVGKNSNKNSSLSGIAGTMFIKSKEMAEDMYAAMECRGFTGEYKVNKNIRFSNLDFIYFSINIAIVLTFIYFERLL